MDWCQLKLNNSSQCLDQIVDFICGHCTEKFCHVHLNEHTKKSVQSSRSNMVYSDSTVNVIQLNDINKSSSIRTTTSTMCTSSYSFPCCSSMCSCTTCSSSIKSTLASDSLLNFISI